jgi:hypothetical protein
MLRKRIYRKRFSMLNRKLFFYSGLRLLRTVANHFTENVRHSVLLYQTCTAFLCSLPPLILSEQNVFRRVVLKAQKRNDHKNGHICCSELLVSCQGAWIRERNVRGSWCLSECGEILVRELWYVRKTSCLPSVLHPGTASIYFCFTYLSAALLQLFSYSLFILLFLIAPLS